MNRVRRTACFTITVIPASDGKGIYGSFVMSFFVRFTFLAKGRFFYAKIQLPQVLRNMYLG